MLIHIQHQLATYTQLLIDLLMLQYDGYESEKYPSSIPLVFIGFVFKCLEGPIGGTVCINIESGGLIKN